MYADNSLGSNNTTTVSQPRKTSVVDALFLGGS